MATETKIDIWNRALARVGHSDAVGEEEEDSAAGQQCRIAYDDCLKQALEEFPWPFATKHVVLVEDASATREGYDYCYTLPTDCVKPGQLLPDGYRASQLDAEMRLPYSLKVDDDGVWFLLCTDAEVGVDFDVLEYTALVEYVPMYPAAFISALSFLLARDLAYSLVKDPNMADAMYQRYQYEVVQAKANMLNSQQPDLPTTTPSIAARG